MDPPSEIHCKDQIFDLALHGQSDILAAAIIDGTVEIHRYDGTVDQDPNISSLLFTLRQHEGACRCVAEELKQPAVFVQQWS